MYVNVTGYLYGSWLLLRYTDCIITEEELNEKLFFKNIKKKIIKTPDSYAKY